VEGGKSSGFVFPETEYINDCVLGGVVCKF
jgi:hypothetical protein